ncbi:penicillin-binding protein 2 [Pedomonas sp. V897]|uniref:penicillin-binding protein 2 n=1 Tax=Pedomonas sp. V897 TaxID=3446482 RepID=UPI003EDFA5BB
MSMETEADRIRVFTRRALILGGAKAMVFATLAARMGYLSVFENNRYKLLAEDNRISIRPILPRRGLILDRNGYPLALNRQDYRLTLVPEEVEDLEATLDAIHRVIPLDEEDRQKVRDMVKRVPGFMPVEVVRDIDWQAFTAINVQLPTLSGVQPVQGYTRYYPDGEAVAHVLGYVGAPNDKVLEQDPDPILRLPGFKVGRGGVEQTLDKTLRGRAGADRVEVNARGRILRSLGRTEDTPGDAVTLTLDRELQVYAAWRLQGEAASAVVIDVHTGDILALCSTPAFDPNDFSGGIKTRVWKALLEDEKHPLLNKPLQGLYPPGSTFKMVVTLAALEAGIRPEEGVFCSGRYMLGSHAFHCWKRGGHGHVNMRRAIFQSCDTWYYDISRRIGIDAIARMARRFGLGQEYDLPLPSQRSGLVPDPAWKRKRYGKPWLAGETLNASIGQGYMQATPLQLAVMTARLASGREVVPRLLRAEGAVAPARPLGVPEEHLRLVREAMSAVINSAEGTARVARLRLPGVTMAGKTGTAQVRRISAAERRTGVLNNNQLPWRFRDHALFVAYAPVEAPRYACAVVVDHGGSGSAAASPVARDIMTFLLARERRDAGESVPEWEVPDTPPALPQATAGAAEALPGEAGAGADAAPAPAPAPAPDAAADPAAGTVATVQDATQGG